MGLECFRQLRPAGRATLRRRAPCVLAALVLLFPAHAFAQSAIGTTDSQAAILEEGAIVKIDDMDFGTIARPLAAGSVILNPGPTVSCITSAGIVHTRACQPARFAVMGKRRDRIRIRENNGGTIVLTGPGGATMTVTNLTISVSDMTSVGGGGWNLGRYEITTDSGIAEFRIGGRLNIGANQAAGAYNGELHVQTVIQ